MRRLINKLKEIKTEAIEEIRTKILRYPNRTKFCAAVISNDINTDGFRLSFINIFKFKKINNKNIIQKILIRNQRIKQV